MSKSRSSVTCHRPGFKRFLEVRTVQEEMIMFAGRKDITVKIRPTYYTYLFNILILLLFRFYR